MEHVLEHIAMLAQSEHVSELQAPLSTVDANNKKRTAASVAPLQVQMKRLRTQARAEVIVAALVHDMVEAALSDVSS